MCLWVLKSVWVCASLFVYVCVSDWVHSDYVCVGCSVCVCVVCLVVVCRCVHCEDEDEGTRMKMVETVCVHFGVDRKQKGVVCVCVRVGLKLKHCAVFASVGVCVFVHESGWE